MDWSFNAQTMLDQLPPRLQARTLSKLSKLEADIRPGAPLPPELKLLGSEASANIYSFRVLPDWLLAIREQDQVLTVVDIARLDQIDFLRELNDRHHALQE